MDSGRMRRDPGTNKNASGLRLAAHRDSVVRFVPMTPAVDASDLKELEADLRGRIYLLGSEGYDQARQVWNGSIDKARSPSSALLPCRSQSANRHNSSNQR